VQSSRRKFIIASTLGGAGAIYVQQRGLRYPRLGFEHRPPVSELSISPAELALENVIYVDTSDDSNGSILSRFRATAPEPKIKLASPSKTTINLRVANIASTSRLQVNSNNTILVDEKTDDLTRDLTITLNGEDSATLQWMLAEPNEATFAVIGDTGAGLELEWLLKRAQQLGAQFLLHLGDFNYVEGEYNRAIELFNAAAMPCYISIGNHDYNDSGLIYQQFIDELGPMNNSFTVAGTRFANMDSAANFFPVSGGQRAKLFQRLRAEDNSFSDQVFFTHRPFYDIRPGEDHVLGRASEMNWLKQQIREVDCDTILTGHVHRSGETDLDGLRQWTVGEGLGFQDIVNQKLVSKLLIGKAETGKKVVYSWADINMPWLAHQSPTHVVKLKREFGKKEMDWYLSQLKKETGLEL